MSIKKNIRGQEINYKSKNDSGVMENIISKQKDYYFKNNNTDNVESMSFDVKHQVTRGENLSQIASKYGLTYQQLAEYNHIADPNYIEVGQIINIPSNQELEEEKNNISINLKHQVKSGENLSQIASKYGLTYQQLAEYNHIADPNYIEVDQIINIPFNKEIDEDINFLISDAIKNGAKNINEQVKNLALKLNIIRKNNNETAEKALDEITKKIKETLSLAGNTADKIIENIKKSYEQEKVLSTKEELNEDINSLISDAIKNGAKNINEQVQNLALKLNIIRENNNETAEKTLNQLIIKIKDAFYNAGYYEPNLINNIISLINDKYNMIKTLSSKDNYTEYTIASGDTLSKIATKYGISLDKLIKLNNISDPNIINVGQVLKIPGIDEQPKKKKNVTKDIDLSKILKNNKIGAAIEKYSKEINNAFKVKINEKEFITIEEAQVDGNACYITHVIINDPANIKGEPANGSYAQGLEKSSSAAKRTKASLLINGSHFLSDGSQDLNSTNHLAIVNGKIVKEGSSLGMEICLDKNGKLFTPSPGTTAQQLIDKGVIYTFSSHDSLLLQDGQKYPDQEGKVYNSTVIGMKEPGEYYILTGATSNAGARDYLYDKGCTYAKSMDQGGSVTLVFEGEIINNPTDSTGERSVGDFLYFS